MTGRRWFSSDLHLGHERICELANRPFSSVQEMNDELVRRWNEVVAPEDTVFILGDLAMGNLRESLDRVRELQGCKILVPGNHDRVSSLYKGSPAKKAEWSAMYKEVGLHIEDEEVEYTTLPSGRVVILHHFPFVGDSHGADRYASARPADNGRIVWHGHVHSPYRQSGPQIHVGVDAWNYAPVAEEVLLEMSLNTS